MRNQALLWGFYFFLGVWMRAGAEVFYTDQSPYATEIGISADGSSSEDMILKLRGYLTDHQLTERDASYAWAAGKYGTLLQEATMRRSAPSSAIRQEALKYLTEAIQLALDLDGDISEDLLYFWSIREAILLHSMGQAELAKESCELALTLAQTDLERSTALYHVGNSLLMMGEASEALLYFRRSLKLAPERLNIYRDIIRCNKVSKALSKIEWFMLLEEIERAVKGNAEKERIQEETEAEVLWALHEAAEAAGYAGAAWGYLVNARTAEIKRRSEYGETYDSEIAIKTTRQIIASFHEGFWPASNSGVGSKSMLPVFIVGMPRSGSTLLESILEAHKGVSTVREDSVLAANIGYLQKEELDLRAMFLSASGDNANPDDTEGIGGKFSGAYATAWRNLIRVHADNITEHMREEASIATGRKLGDNEKRIVDKFLSNYKYIGVIHLLFPKATIINIVRDPRDVVISLMKHNFAHPSLGWTLSDKDLLQEYIQYTALMQHWENVLPKGRIQTVTYENIVNEPEITLRNLFSRVGLKFDSKLLSTFHKSYRPYILTPSFLQIREPINNKSVGAWKKYILHPSFQKFVFSLMRALEADGGQPSLMSRLYSTKSWEEEISALLSETDKKSFSATTGD